MKLLPVLLILILVGLVAISVKESLVAPFKAAAEPDNAASDSAQMSKDFSQGAEVSGGTGAENQGTKHSQNGNTYTSINTEENVLMKGTYKLSTYNVEFNINMPKSGGDISGTLSGTCEGKITGKAGKPNEAGESVLNGEYSGTCKPIPTLSFKTNAGGTFKGVAKFKEGKAGISVNNTEPFSTGSYFEMYF